MPELPSVLGAVANNKGVLHSLYTDLAAPGVRQVGSALETVLKTGNILLLPLRMLNDYAAGVERRNFADIANRFKTIAEDDIVDVRPEIGAPILDKLSVTQDARLRQMFIELLASAADKNRVAEAHPSFVRVIEGLSPDEAKILADWKGRDLVPCLMIGLKADDGGSRLVCDPFLEVADSVECPSLVPMYVANMEGMGLLAHYQDRHLTTEGAYDSLIDGVREQIPNIKEKRLLLLRGSQEPIEAGDHFYEKGCVQITPYGKMFQRACVSET